MTPFENTSLCAERRVSLLSFSLLPALVACAFLLLLGQVYRLHVANRWIDHTDQVIAQAHLVSSRIADAEAGLRGLAITGNPDFRTSLERARESLPIALADLRAITRDNESQSILVESTKFDIERWSKFADQVLGDLTEGRSVRERIASLEGKRIADRIRARIEEMVSIENGLKERRLRGEVRETWIFVGIVVVLFITLVVFGTHVFLRNRRWEAALLASEHRFRSLVEGAKDYSIYLLSPAGEVVSWNFGAERLKGYSAEEAIGRHFASFFPPEIRETEASDRWLKEALEHGSSQFECPVIRKDGSRFWAASTITPIENSAGELEGFVKITHDLTERKKYEEELERWQHIFRHAHWGIASVGADSRFLMVNPEFCRMHGYTEEELIGQPSSIVYPPEERGDLDRNIELTNAQGRHIYEAMLRRKDGSTFPAMMDVTAVKDESGKLLYRAGYAQDITEMKAAQARTQEAEAKYKALVEAASDSILIVDSEGVIVFSNPYSHTAFGYQPDELHGKSVEVLVPERFRSKHELLRENYEKNPEARTMGIGREIFALRKDGTELPVEVSLSPIRVNGRTFITAVVRDVTARKRDERAQRFLADVGLVINQSMDVEKCLTGLADLALTAIGDWIVIDLIGGDGRVERAASACRTPEIRGRVEEFERLHPFDSAEAHRSLEELKPHLPLLVSEIDETELLRFFGPKAAADARKIGARSAISLSLWARGRIVGVMTCFSITHRFTIEDLNFAGGVAQRAAFATDNAMLYRKAQAAIRAREDILGIVSHDLKNPLASIRLGADFGERILSQMESDRPPVSQLRRLLRQILHSTTVADRLITDLLDLAKIEAGNFSVEVGEVEPNEALREVEAAFAPIANEKGVKLEIEYPESSPPIEGDLHRISQVLANLVGNAVKFSPAKSTISVSSYRESNSRERIFVVEDHGPGIAPEVLPHVFDRYWQPKETRAKGAGLGLYIAKGIVESHHGKIWVESEPGRGTRISFSVPEAGSATG